MTGKLTHEKAGLIFLFSLTTVVDRFAIPPPRSSLGWEYPEEPHH